MKLILAQGNPSSEYSGSRHNTGFMALDFFKKQHDLPDFQAKSKFQAEISEYSINSEKIILAKPTTFYNLTGQSARAIADFYNISLENILVIHDDLTLNFGTIRVRRHGSDAGNNGIKSLNAHLGQDFWRLRIGIKNTLNDRIADADFVLGKFSEEEKGDLEKIILPEACRLIEKFTQNSLDVDTQKVLQIS